MKLRFQVILIKFAVNICLLIFKREIILLHFIYTKTKDLEKLVEKHPVYQLTKDGISKYYIYEEPGRPVKCTEYYSLQDFILDILISSAYGKIHTDSLKLSYNPNLASDSALKEYLVRHDVVNASMIGKNIIVVDISKHYYTLMYKRLDQYVNNFFIAKINDFIFHRGTVIGKDLIGVWKSFGKTRRDYTQQTFTITYRLDDGTEKIEQCSISKLFPPIISMEVISYDDKLNYEERIMLSEDKNTLVVYNQYGRSVWKKTETL